MTAQHYTSPRSLRDIPAVNPIRERDAWVIRCSNWQYRNRWWIAGAIVGVAATCIAWGLS